MARFQPTYKDAATAEKILARIAVAPRLVTRERIDALLVALSRVHAERAFVLQAGPCAELFEDSEPSRVAQMAALLGRLAAAMPGQQVVTLLRGAGQYAKPRNASHELRGGVQLPSYAGDLINRLPFREHEREPDPLNLALAYEEAAQTIRGLAHAPHIYTSHEALHLAWEQAQLQVHDGVQYLHSAHTVWIGDKTRDLDDAHVSFAAGIANPVGVKLGPTATPQQAAALALALNPHKLAGKLSLIVRLGLAHTALLDEIVIAVQQTGVPVLWLSDPMHGNTRLLPSGRKVRDLDRMTNELVEVATCLHARGEHLAGLHLEVSADDIAECIGEGVTEQTLHGQLACDPRLNEAQALALARAFGATSR